MKSFEIRARSWHECWVARKYRGKFAVNIHCRRAVSSGRGWVRAGGYAGEGDHPCIGHWTTDIQLCEWGKQGERIHWNCSRGLEVMRSWNIKPSRFWCRCNFLQVHFLMLGYKFWSIIVNSIAFFRSNRSSITIPFCIECPSMRLSPKSPISSQFLRDCCFLLGGLVPHTSCIIRVRSCWLMGTRLVRWE